MGEPRKTDVVLIVEDEPLIRMVGVCILQDEEFEVREAANADEAIAILEVEEVNLIFTDVHMPGSMDSLGLADYVQEQWPPIKIIITSGHGMRTAASLPFGAMFMPKPYDSGALTNCIRTMIARAESHQHAS
jgi:DNA-binding NtrC family response regulator